MSTLDYQATSLKIELYLTAYLVDENGDQLTDESGNFLVADGWANVSSDVLLSSNPTWTQGNSGRTVFDRVANVGTLSFALDNSTANASGEAGIYSPDRSNVINRFGLDTKVRITVTENGTEHEEWQGKISKISPDPGVYGKRSTIIHCEDWMAFAQKDNISGITVQSGKRDDELLTTILTLASEQPQSTTFSTGDDTYTYALHDENSLKSSLIRLFQKIAMSGFGRIFLTGWNNLVYLSRSDLLVSGTPSATLYDTMTDLKVTRDKSLRVKDVKVTTFPAQVDGSPAVLWAAQRELIIAAGDTETFDISFRDPDGRAERIAALSLETLTASTDFKFSSTTGSGEDLNANLDATVSLKADIATCTLSNTSASTGYLWFHQQRGTGIYLYEPITSTGNTGQADGETLNIEMVYQDDPNIGTDIKNLVVSWYAVDQSEVESVTFLANYDSDLISYAFLPVGSLVTIIETQTGINRNYIINGVSKTYSNGLLYVTWYPVQANQLSGVCILDLVGAAELDDTAYLGA